MWPICFAVLFGQDVASIDFERTFDLYNLLATFMPREGARVVHPEILPVITAMLQNGLRSIITDQEEHESTLASRTPSRGTESRVAPTSFMHNRQRSMSLTTSQASTGE